MKQKDLELLQKKVEDLNEIVCRTINYTMDTEDTKELENILNNAYIQMIKKIKGGN